VSPSFLRSIARPQDQLRDYVDSLPEPVDVERDRAERFMQGLKAQHDDVIKRLRDDQLLIMYCYHGPERLIVLSIHMPSSNVVSMKCLDDKDQEICVTCHLHAVTFSFVSQTVAPPVVRTPIGFRIP